MESLGDNTNSKIIHFRNYLKNKIFRGVFKFILFSRKIK